MIKQIRASYFANFKNAQYCALSTDSIPDYLENGDEVYMINTGKNYFWDAISSDLYEDKSSSSLDAGQIAYDATQTYPSGSIGAEVSTQKNAISANKEAVADTQSMIATVEATATASKNYAVGDLLVYDGKLYKVTSAIATGATIIVGSNVTQTTVETQIASASGVAEDWVKIRDDTLTEAEATHIIDTDSGGNTFVLKDAIVYIISTAGSAQNGYLTLFNVNNISTQVNVGNIVNTGVVRTVIRCERIADRWNIMLNTPTNNYRDIDKANMQMFCGLISSNAPVNIAKISLQATSFPAGTQFIVYGRYA